MKRFISSVLAASLVAGSVAIPAFAAEFTDIQDHWAKDAIQQVSDWKLFTGNENGEFMPDGTMTRGMFVTVMERGAKMLNVYQEPEQTVSFVDVQSSDYFASGVAWAQANGLVNGVGDNRFAPNNSISREEMCVLMDRFLRTFTDYDLDAYLVGGNKFLDGDKIADYAKNSVNLCVALGLIQGVPVEGGVEFQPKQSATRAAVAVILGRLVPVIDELPPVPEVPEEPEVPGGGGSTENPDNPNPPVEGPTEQEKAEEAQAAQYLQIMLDNYRNFDYSTMDKEVQDCVAILMNAISDALVQRQKGQFLDRAFIQKNYATQIEQLKVKYDQLTDSQFNDAAYLINSLATTEQLYFVMDYFGISLGQ